MKLSIIILNYNTRGLLRQCLKAINANSPDCSYEVIVVDNNSADRSADMVSKEFPNAILLAEKSNLGYAGGNNRGLQVAKGDYMMILNPDVLVLPNSFDALVDFMDKNEDVGLAGPKLLNPDKTLQLSCYRFPKIITPILRRTPFGKFGVGKEIVDDYLMRDWDHASSRNVDWLLGGAMIVRRKAYEQVGGLDEQFFLYFDDVDYAKRMHEAGWKVMYAPDSEMIHFHQRDSAGSIWPVFTNKVTRIHVLSAIKYFSKWRRIR